MGNPVRPYQHNKQSHIVHKVTKTHAKLLIESAKLDKSQESDMPNSVDEYKEEVGFNLNAEDMKKFHIWPSGIIPYFIDDVSFDKVLRDKIRLFLDNINSLTGLRFLEIPKPPTDEERWVMFLNRIGQLDCVDHPFYDFTNEGVQRVVLGYDCISTDGGMSAVILSLVGVPPQHNAPNRDEKIIVKKENILPDKLYLFEKLKDDEWLFHDLRYDLQSAGHYGNHKYTANGGVTIISRIRPRMSIRQYIMGEHKGLTDTDIMKIKMLYNYISRNRETPSDIPECSKLFEAGTKLPESVSLKVKNNVKPRNKPSKYLGITEKGDSKYNHGNSQGEENENEGIKNNNEHSKRGDESNYDVSGNNNESGNEKHTNNKIKNDKKELIIEMSIEKHDSKESKLKDEKTINTDKHEETDTENKNATNKVKFANNSSKLDIYEETAENVSRNRSRVPLSQKINSNKAKFLGKSDYETGDDDDKKYKHE